MNDPELKRALELYRTGKIDQAADLLNIEDVPSRIKHPSNTYQVSNTTQAPNTAQEPNTFRAPNSIKTSEYKKTIKSSAIKPPPIDTKLPTKPSYNTMVLDTTQPTITESVNLTNELVPFQPKLPNFFPAMAPEFDFSNTNTSIQTNNGSISKEKSKENVNQSNLIPNTQNSTQPKTVASDEKVLGQNLPREIEAGMLKWLQIDGDLDKLRQIKRDLDEQKKALEDQIKSFMEKWEIPEIGPNQEVGLEFQVKEVKQGFTKKLVTDTLNKMFNNVECEKILQVMESQRSVTEKTCLKLKKPKKPKTRK